VMRQGHQLESPSLAEIRARAATNLTQLPKRLRALEEGAAYPVEISSSLRELAQALDAVTNRALAGAVVS
jgi:nicotinate phosphoribosyltransferase